MSITKNINKKYLADFDQDNLFIDINKAASDYDINLRQMPYISRIFFENVIRHTNDIKYINQFAKYTNKPGNKLDHQLNHQSNNKSNDESDDILFYPTRILMQDFTGVPALVDLASMRDAAYKRGFNPQIINPMINIDLVVDHSLRVKSFGKEDSFNINVKDEIINNKERYEFLKWARENFNNLSLVPPGSGICHQFNLEYLAKILWQDQNILRKDNININKNLLYPDSLVGTDSHTPMINALGIIGWGVGGIEAEAAMLNMPITIKSPEVIGVKLVGKLKDHVTATDLVLYITNKLRATGVVGKFLEFFGSSLQNISIVDRATIANMTPEFGATCSYFPVDDKTIEYLQITGRDQKLINLIKDYYKKQNLWHLYEDSTINNIKYSKIITIDLSEVSLFVSGPNRPQDKIALTDLRNNFQDEVLANKFSQLVDNDHDEMQDGSVVIAAITSCTNTSNPAVMIGAGLIAKKACEFGLKTKPWVKTSLAPGSKVVTEYLKNAGLDQYLDDLGFNLVGYGCTTCIGNSGPLDKDISDKIKDRNLKVAAILSGNRNFAGRIHPLTKAQYLASPMLVVLYALVGSVNIDLENDPIAIINNKKIFLQDLWPSKNEIDRLTKKFVTDKIFKEKYKDIFVGEEEWNNIKVTKSHLYHWDKENYYINNPPFFDNLPQANSDVKNARIIALFGDSITTDHISPAGHIDINSDAAKFLMSKNIQPEYFNSYGARRGNHDVMIRGTFANIRIKNLLCKNKEGGFTVNYEDNGQIDTIYNVANYYMKNNIDSVIFAGHDYGMGSSRDWAAKGTKLLGIRAVIAKSFERIHRSNLIGMGVVPLILDKEIRLDGDEIIDINNINDNLKLDGIFNVVIKNSIDNTVKYDLSLKAAINTQSEIEYLKYNGILNYALDSLVK